MSREDLLPNNDCKNEIKLISFSFVFSINGNMAAKLRKKIRISATLTYIFNIKCIITRQNKGSAVHALGALMRIERQIVGAIRSVVTGISMRAWLTPGPISTMGNCMYVMRCT